jgi:hypothetical protein
METAMQRAQIKHGRAIGLMIDGETPNHSNWSVGETKYGFSFRDSLDSDEGVQCGPHTVTGISYKDHKGPLPVDVMEEGNDPSHLIIHTDEGDFELPVVDIQDDEANACYHVIATTTPVPTH